MAKPHIIGVSLCLLHCVTYTLTSIVPFIIKFLFALILYIVKMNIVMYLKPHLHVMLISVLHNYLGILAFDMIVYIQDCS